MDEDIETASKFETYGVKLFNAATIAAVAYLVLFVDISGRGRGIDVLKGLVGSSTAASGPTLSKPHVVVVNGLEADSSRMMVTPEQGPATQASVERQRGPTAAELAAGVAPVGGAKEDSRRLKGSLESIGEFVTGSGAVTQRSAAQANNAPTYQTTSYGGGADATIAASNAAADARSAGAQARYGSAGRNDMMGRAAGPVYNLKGGGVAGAKQGAGGGTKAATATQTE